MKSHTRSLVVLLRRTNTLVQDCWNQFAIRVSLRSASVELRALCVSVVSSNGDSKLLEFPLDATLELLRDLHDPHALADLVLATTSAQQHAVPIGLEDDFAVAAFVVP